MDNKVANQPAGPHLDFRLGTPGALAPLLLFVTGVALLGLSGAPDERGFWPILLAALGVGFLLSTSPTRYAESVLAGMSRPIVMLMVLAWMLAGVLASALTNGGFVEALVSVSGRLGLGGGSYTAAAFIVAGLVSTSTGTSLGTLILCVPLLYPAGVLQGADPVWLIGALLGGATFGDNVSPVSDTTVASATSQGAEMGAVVRSRLKYALPAAAVALGLAWALGGGAQSRPASVDGAASLGALWLGLGPVTAVTLLLRKTHLVPALLAGSFVAFAVGIIAGVFQASDLLRIDAEAFGARGLILSGMERGVGISVFTILLMGLVGGFEGTGLLDRWIDRLSTRIESARAAEARIVGATSLAVLLTTHSVVALLAVGDLGNKIGSAAGIPATRRANLMDLTVCTYPFLLPFFIPTILASSLTLGGGAGVPAVPALAAGLANVHSWALLAMTLFAITTGYGRSAST